MTDSEIDLLAIAYMATTPPPIADDPHEQDKLDSFVGDTFGALFDPSSGLLVAGDQRSIRRFVIECCRDKDDEELAYFGAGVPEEIVNGGRVQALQGLVEAARSDRFVRRSLGFAWFSPTTTDPEALELIAEIESLAIHGQTEA